MTKQKYVGRSGYDTFQGIISIDFKFC